MVLAEKMNEVILKVDDGLRDDGGGFRGSLGGIDPSFTGIMM
jgi:hypothetical protein